MRIILITTASLASMRPEEFARLRDSVTRSRLALPDVPIHHALLFQNAPSGAPLPMDPHVDDIVLRADGRLSLSSARNRIIEEVRNRGYFDAGAVVAFPDDDAWYPDGFLPELQRRFAADPSLCVWFCRYGSQPVALGSRADAEAGIGRILRSASSNTIVLRGSLMGVMPPFDERLGVGARLPGGEDTDYALAAWARGPSAMFVDAPCIGHRDYTPALRTRYYGPALAAILRHALAVRGARRSTELWIQLLRKIGVGATYVLRGEMRLRDYAAALQAARRFATEPAPRGVPR